MLRTIALLIPLLLASDTKAEPAYDYNDPFVKAAIKFFKPCEYRNGLPAFGNDWTTVCEDS